MKKLILVLLLITPTALYAQQTASYGLNVTSLNTSSTGAVTGTAFAIPNSFSNVITWTVVADGSALSVNLEGSNDNSTYFTIDTQTTATGGIKNYGPSNLKFVRCSAVSRTGGTNTNCTIITNKGAQVNAGTGTSSTSFTASRFLAGDGSSASPSFSFTNEPTGAGLYRSGASDFRLSLNGGTDFYRFTTGAFVINGASTFAFAPSGQVTGADTTLSRNAAGKLTLTGTTPMFQLGGTTSSFPALKQSGTTIQVRLADDSADATLSVSRLFFATSVFATNLLIGAAAPTISSGFGTSPSISSNNGTASFVVNVGTGGTATSGTIGLPTATTGWNCYVTDQNAAANHTGLRTFQTSTNTTAVTIESQNSAGAATAWATGSFLRVSCFAY